MRRLSGLPLSAAESVGMHFALAASLALAALPVAVASQDSNEEEEEEPAVALPPAIEPRAGAYRTTLELLEFEASARPTLPADQLNAAREAFAAELASGNDFCLAAEPASEPATRRLLAQVAEGECTVDRLERDGAAVSATLSCVRPAAVDGVVSFEGRIFSENSTLDMTLTQDVPGLGATRMRLLAKSARVGDC